MVVQIFKDMLDHKYISLQQVFVKLIQGFGVCIVYFQTLFASILGYDQFVYNEIYI